MMVETIQQYNRKYIKKEENTLINLVNTRNFQNITVHFKQ